MNNRHSIAIIMGGTDPKGLIIPLLQELNVQQNLIPVRVLVNRNYAHLEELQRLIPQWDFAVQLVINGTDLANIFNNAKLVISAAGGTQFELLAMHTPALLLSVADNQINASEQSQAQGWCEHFDCRNTLPLKDIVERGLQLLSEPDVLQSMHDAASHWADYRGTERLLDAILEIEQND